MSEFVAPLDSDEEEMEKAAKVEVERREAYDELHVLESWQEMPNYPNSPISPIPYASYSYPPYLNTADPYPPYPYPCPYALPQRHLTLTRVPAHSRIAWASGG